MNDPYFCCSYVNEYMSSQDLDNRRIHPQQNTFKFKKDAALCFKPVDKEQLDFDLMFSSQFDSGNLRSCVATEAGKPECRCFNLYTSGDSAPYDQPQYKTWFYFSVRGMAKGDAFTFSIKNMGLQGKLFKTGLRPVYRSVSNQKWRRVQGDVAYKNEKTSSTVTWTHTFDELEDPADVFYFAYTYPYSYTESIIKSRKIINRIQKSKQAYIHREVLAYSLEGREMEMLTLSSFKGILNIREPVIEGQGCLPHGDQLTRPMMFEGKKTIFLTCRVHPGETPASYVLNGILNFLTSKNYAGQQQDTLLDNFVFKIIPMLNPDGVYRGYYRLDTRTQNLNRYYLEPTPHGQPTILAAKAAVMHAKEHLNLQAYVDIHAHATKRGCFMFGNSLKGQQ